jgi:TetR/AcrR family transcriptional repressor of mexJK operon
MNVSAAKESIPSRTAARLRLYHMLSVGAPAALGRELHALRERGGHYEEPSVRAQTPRAKQNESEACRSVVDAIAQTDAGRASRTMAALLGEQALDVLRLISPSFDPSRLRMAAALAVTHTLQDPLASKSLDTRDLDTVGLSWIDPLESRYPAAPKATPGARGRPPDPNKREAILKAARDLFLTYGPSAVTMNRLAEAANVAKATVYACYEDKNAVIVAMVRRESELVMPDNWQDEHNHAALAAMLIDFGQAFLGFMVNPQLQSLERLISGLASHDAELGDRLFFAGPGRAMNVLRAILSKARTQGHIKTDSIEEAAEDLLGLWQGFLRIEVNFHQLPDPKASYLRQRAARGVRQFLKLYAPMD